MIDRRKFLAEAAAVTSISLFPQSIFAEQQKKATLSEHLKIRLKNNRQLSYAIYGDPQGWPVLYFHGIPTSRIEARFFTAAARRANCCLIAIDRPGFGLSSFLAKRRVVDWLDDIKEFVHASPAKTGVDLRRFSISCFSSGAAYALLCAAKMPRRQIASVAVVDGIAPLEKISGHGGVSQTIFQLANKRPRLANSLLNLHTRQIRRNPKLVLRRISRFFSPCDSKVFFQPASAKILVDSYLQCVACGPTGVAYDMSLLSKPWGFDLKEINVPVGIWYGDSDITTPARSMGKYLHATIKNSEYSVWCNQGHLSMLNVVGDEMFKFLVSSA